MLEQFDLEESERRNLKIVFAIVTLLMAVLIDAPLFSRLVVALFMGLVSGISFLVVTVLLRRFDIPY